MLEIVTKDPIVNIWEYIGFLLCTRQPLGID
jgi:hypothetical protein